jgi:TATA-binding protein-associated factor Taf7
MIESNSSQPASPAPESDSSETTQDIRQRSERLREKVTELSKTFDHIEQTLADAADDPELSKH